MQLELFVTEPIAIPPGVQACVITEEWRDVPQAKGYEVSSFGRFRRGDKYLSGMKNHNGYIHVGFMVNGKQTWFLAHRVVAMAFLDNPFNKPVVNHKDGNRHNNHVGNLDWATKSENAKHGWARKKGTF